MLLPPTTLPMFFAAILSVAFTPLLQAQDQPQAHVQPQAQWQSGYQNDLHGQIIDYGSALPDANSALLIRSEKATDYIAWETEACAAESTAPSNSFVWLFGMDANPEQHPFELSLNGTPLLKFRNPSTASLQSWHVAGESGAQLEFRPTQIDRHGDVFGFAVLHLPQQMCQPGKPLQLKVVGESAASKVWYMTFRHAPRSGATASAPHALLRGESTPFQRVMVNIVHLGAPTSAQISTSWGTSQDVQLELGANQIELRHPQVQAPCDESLSIRAENGTGYQLQFRVEPVREWTVHLVQHTHTDLGYTRPQTEILPDHLRYIDYALDYCDLTDDYPDDAKFRWTCEAAWPVREYLRYRPEAQIERLRRRIAEGRIELTAMFANLSELISERGCSASLEPVREMRKHRLPVYSAMQDDVNGIAWVYADLLPELGVRYLNMGEHGHRALIPFDVPTAFWWESPSGSRLLAWRPDHYSTGNFWGIHSGRMETVEPALFRYLQGLEQNDYPMDRVAVQYGGVFLDNAPPGIIANDFIRSWNERFIWPHLRSSTVSEFPRIIEQESAAELPVWRAAWPDWWSDGIGAAPREAAAVRVAQNELAAVEGMLSMVALQGTTPSQPLLQRVSGAWDQLVLYGEHTYGAAESVSDPGAENSQVQWAEKSAFAWDAVKETAILKEAAFGLLQGAWRKSNVPIITVVNTLAWPRSGMVKVFIDNELLPPGQNFRLSDSSGKEVPAQIWQAKHDGNWWAMHVDQVPAFGWSSYKLELLDGKSAQARAADVSAVLENSYYRLEVDLERGGVVSLQDKELGCELVDKNADWGFGQLIHETLGNRWQIERKRLDDFERTGLLPTRLQAGVQGPLWRSLFLRGTAQMCPEENGLEIEVRLYEIEKRVEFRYRIRKREETSPEGLYASFPFALENPQLLYETLGGVVNPEKDQLPRTSTDWQAAQRFVTIANSEAQIILSSPEILLHHFGGLNLGRFQDRAQIDKPHVYSWLLNNYWVTNFPASQDGELFWSQSITSGAKAGTKPGAKTQPSNFGWNLQTPFLARVLPPGRKSTQLPPPLSLLQIDGAEVVLISARPTPSGDVLLQLRETADKASEFRINGTDGQPLSVTPADALARPLSQALQTFPEAVNPFMRGIAISIQPYATMHFLIDL